MLLLDALESLPLPARKLFSNATLPTEMRQCVLGLLQPTAGRGWCHPGPEITAAGLVSAKGPLAMHNAT